MKILFYKETPTELGHVIEIDGLKVLITQNLLDINPTKFSYKAIEYVKLTNIPPWSVNNEFNGEIFELSTLNNLLKFGFAPTKEQFLGSLQEWIIIGSFSVTNKTEFVEQEKRKLVDEATKRGLIAKPTYLKYPWQEPSIVRTPSWSGSFTTISESFDEIWHCGVAIYRQGYWAEIAEGYTLKDFEVQLIESDKNYKWLRLADPKLYWTKILSNIAKTFNGTSLSSLDTKYFITYNQFNDISIMKHETVNYGLIYFKTAGDALKAAELMGNKLSYILPKK